MEGRADDVDGRSGERTALPRSTRTCPRRGRLTDDERRQLGLEKGFRFEFVDGAPADTSKRGRTQHTDPVTKPSFKRQDYTAGREEVIIEATTSY